MITDRGAVLRETRALVTDRGAVVWNKSAVMRDTGARMTGVGYGYGSERKTLRALSCASNPIKMSPGVPLG
jgi:hypothetical protein